MTQRFEFKRDPENQMLVGPDGCHYDTEAAAMYYGQMKFCGCGCPEEVHRFTMKCVGAFDRDKVGWGGETGIAAIRSVVSADPEAAAYFIAYAIENMDLTEHGGSVGGSWLTERGKQFLEIGAMMEEENMGGSNGVGY